MRKPGILLLECRDGWELTGAAPGTPSIFVAHTDPVEVVKATIGFANQSAFDRGQVIIAVASQAVLFAKIAAGDAVNIRSNEALRFALESVLPVDAEKIVAAPLTNQKRAPMVDQLSHLFMTSAGNDLNAVAMEWNHVRALVDSLEQSQCKVQFIVPRSMLVFEQAVTDRLLPIPSVSVWLISQDDKLFQAEILELDSEQSIRTWRLTECTADAIGRELLLMNASTVPTYLFGGQRALATLVDSSKSTMTPIEIDRCELAQKRVTALLSGSHEPWIDLRRDQLAVHDRWRRHRGAIGRLLFAAGLLLATVCGTFLWRAQQHRSDTNRWEQQQQALFRQAFPGQRIPAAILARLRSEHAKAAGVRSIDTSTTVPQSALIVLARVIESLQAEFPFEVDEIRIEQGSVALDLKLVSSQDAGKVAAAFAQNGFSVEPPATTLVDGDRIQASLMATINRGQSTNQVNREATP